MNSSLRPTFEFNNHISPRYIEPLFVQMEPTQWYYIADLKALLRQNGIDVEGKAIVLNNIRAWSMIGLGETRREKSGRNTFLLFKLSSFGQQTRELYATNHDLFYDLIHFCFYSLWPKSHSLVVARFWLYWRVCNALWDEAPCVVDSSRLTNLLQQEAHVTFPEYSPSFSTRAVGGVYPWLTMLQPPFLQKTGTKLGLASQRRTYCTPQLFHLGINYVLSTEQLSYGTAVSLSEHQIEEVCRICLLDPEQFWPMAELTELSIRGFELKRGQWGKSVVLSGPPHWIDLPVQSAIEDGGDSEEDGQ